jgi:hypothetical protein
MENETYDYRFGEHECSISEQLRMYVQKTNKEKDMTQTRKFWMITGDGNSPKIRHTSKEAAIKEAERLANNNAGIEFIVLEAIEVITRPVEVIRQKL